jgi:aspartyl-tRNA(Asn)/glutamyl-tRNA(Gln) amidotransferase subunit B
MKYIPTIGLEIHAELKTASKMFCSCKNDPDEEKPNVNICPICMGHPGTLPVLNKEAIKHVLKVGVSVNGKIADFTEWDRKNYFYPDIPKGYQISQYKFPLVSEGELAGVAIERIHLEEDTAQSTHDQHEKSLVNFNRAGVPLMELVTKPVIHDAATAVRFAKELQLLLRYLGAGEANMEKGEMRVEANVSVATEENTKTGKFGTKTEVKNLNSFRSVERAIAYEIARQSEILEALDAAKTDAEKAKVEKIVQETRGWDDNKQRTFSQRSKESSHDYRYFPDPDIPKMKISEIAEFSADALKKELPELPWNKRDRYKKDYGMTDKEVAVFVENVDLAKYFEAIISNFAGDAKKVKLTVNYILTDYLGLLKTTKSASDDSSLFDSKTAISPTSFAELISMIAAGEISSRGAKDTLAILIKEAAQAVATENTALQIISARAVAEKAGLLQKSDAADIGPIIDKVIADNSKVVAEYKAGKVASLQFLIGQAMKAAKGAANPEVVKKMLVDKLV